MLEFLYLLLITFIVISMVTLAIRYGKSPIYMPDAAHVETLLTRLLDQQLSETEWQLFIGVPINHDAMLEHIRQRCQQVCEQHSIRARAGNIRLKEEGYIVIRHLLHRLQADGSRSF